MSFNSLNASTQNPLFIPLPLIKPSTMPSLNNPQDKGTSWLKTFDTPEVMDSRNEYILEALGFSGQKTPLDYRFIDSFKGLLQETTDLMAQEGLTPIDATMPLLDGLSATIKEMSAKSLDIQEYAHTLKSKVEKLKIGEEILLPGGLKATNILYLIKKTDAQNFSITIYNTGAGNEFHHNEIIDSKIYHQSYITYTKVPLSSLCRNEVFQALVELKVSDHESSKLESFYRLINSLGGEKEDPQNFKTYPAAFFKERQFDSTETKVLFALLNHHIAKKGKSEGRTIEESRKQYKLIKFFNQRLLLLSFAGLYFHEESEEKSTFNKQINILVTKWAHSARKLATEGHLPEAILKNCEATVIDILEKLQEKKQIQKNKPLQSNPLTFPAAIELNEPEFDTIAHTSFYYTNPNSSAHSSIPKILWSPYNPPVEWTVDNLIDNLKRSIQALKNEHNNDHNYLAMDPPFVKLAKSLPLPSKREKTIWDALPKENIEEVLLLLEDLISNINHIEPTAEILLGKYSIMAIADKLGRRLPETCLSTFHLPYYGLFKLASLPSIELIDNSENRRMAALKSYFNESIDIDDLDINKMIKNSIFVFPKYANENQLCDKTIQEYAYLSYYNNLLQQDHIKKQLPTKNSKAIQAQLAMLFDGTITLPKSINALKNICLNTCYHDETSENRTIDYRYDISYDDIIWKEWKIQLYVIKEHNSDLDDSPQVKTIGSTIQSAFNFNSNCSPIISNTKRFPQNETIERFDEEEYREYYILSTNFEDEVVRALSYYHEQDGLLEYPNHQAFLRAHLLRPGRLYSQVTGEPRTALKLIAFLNTKIDFFLSVGKRDHALFFIELAHICQNQINEIQTEFPDRFAPIQNDLNAQKRDYFADVHKILHNSPSLKSKKNAYLTLSQMHAASFEKCIDKLNHNDAEVASEIILQWLIEPLFAEQQSEETVKKNPSITILEEKQQLLKWQLNDSLFAFISQKMESDNIFNNAVLNKVISTIKNAPVVSTWTYNKDTQSFESENSTYRIDLNNLRIFENGKPHSLFPNWILENETFRAIIPPFKDYNAILSEANGISFFEITCDNGKIFEVYTIEMASASYDNYARTIPTTKDIVIKTTLDDSGTKFRYVKTSDFNSQILAQLPSPLKGPETKIWIQDVISAEGPFDVCMETKEGRRFWAKFKVKNGITSLTKINDKRDAPTKRLLIANEVKEIAKSKEISSLFNFMNHNNILFWSKTGSTCIDEMEIPGFGKFIIKKGIAKSMEISGFFLSPEQECDFIGKGPKYLLLINSKGDRKVIMQRTTFVANQKDDPTVDAMRPELSTGNGLDRASLIYDLDEVNGVTRLIPGSVSDSLYLVYMMMTKMQYRQALYYLNQSCDTFKYTKNDHLIIAEIKKLIENTPTPSAVAIALRLFVMTHENTLKYGSHEKPVEVSKEDAKSIAAAYLFYLTHFNNITLRKLSKNEERTILRIIQTATDKEIEDAKKQAEKVNEKSTNAEYILNSIQSSLINNVKTLVHPLINLRLIALTNKSGTHDTFKSSIASLQEIRECSLEIETPRAFLTALLNGKPEKLVPLPPLTEISSIRNYIGNFYAIAQRGNEKEKKCLNDTLFVVKNMLSEGNSSTLGDITFILAVLKNPKKFPSQHEIKKTLRTSDNETSEKYVKRLTSLCDKIKSNCSPSIFSQLFSALKNSFSSFIDNYQLKVPLELLNELKFGLPDLNGVNPNESAIGDLHDYESLVNMDIDFDNTFKAYEEEINNNDNLKKLIEKITEQLILSKQELVYTENTIVTGINKIDSSLSVEERLKRWGKEKPALTLEDAEELFERGTMEGYKEYTSLSEEDIRKIDQEIGEYLVKKTRIEQKARLLAELKKCHSAHDNAEKVVLKERCLAETKGRRNHLNTTTGSTTLSRTYLVFEKRNQILLRKNQVESLDQCALYEKDPMELLKQLSTGSGKSKGISPIMQWLRARLYGKGKKMVMNLWPLSLYNENKKDMRHIVGKSFDQHSDSFDFARHHDVSKECLAQINRTLTNAIVEGRQLNATPESIQAMELKFLECLYNAACEDDEPEEGKIAFFQEILNHYSTAEAHIDECHLNCSPKREVNFTIGQPKTEPIVHVKLISELYHLMCDDNLMVNNEKKLKDLLGIKENQQYNLTYDDYIAYVMPTLANAMADYLGIADADRSLYFDYVTGKMTGEIPDALKNHNRIAEIALLRGELTFMLCNIKSEEIRVGTLFGSTGVHYGLTKKKPDEPGYVEYAKPYEANDVPNEPAQFDNIHEALNKTFQTYLHNRLSQKQLWDLVLIFQKQAIEEAKSSSKDTHDTEGYKNYQRLFNPTQNGLPDLFFIEKELLIEKMQAVNATNELILYYVENVVVPTMTKFSKKLRSNPQNLQSIFNNSIKMTATPGNPEIYGLNVDFKEETTIVNDIVIRAEKHIEEMLLSKCPKDKGSVFTTPHTKAPDILKDLIASRLTPDTKARMLIDIGALFKGMSNKAVAEALLKHFKENIPSIQGVVFFAENNKMMVLTVNGDMVPINQCQLDPKHRFSYCDQMHAFGADIKQFPEAVGICTWDQFVDKLEILQGVGRLREFVNGAQEAEWFVPEIALDAINATKSGQLTSSDNVTFHTLYNYSKKVLNERQSDLLLLSLKQQMRNEVRSACMKKLRSTKDPQQVIALFKKMKAALVDETNDNPFNLYGQIVETGTGAELLQIVRKNTLKLLESISGLDDDTATAIRQKLQDDGDYDKKIQELEEQFPKKVELHNTEMGLQCEAQQETQTQVNVQVFDITGDNKRKLRAETPWDVSFDPYTANWTAPCSTVDRINNAARAIINAMKTIFFWGATPTIRYFKIVRWVFEEYRGPVILKFLAPPALPLIAIINAVAFAILTLPVYIALGIALGSVMLVKGLGNLMWICLRVKNPNVPLYRASDVIKTNKDKDLAAMHSLFTETKEGSLMMSNNFVNLRPYALMDTPITPLGNEQKSAYEVLVIIDTLENGKKKYTVIMGDQSTDAVYWRKKLREDYENTKPEDAAKRTRQMCLYDLHTGIVQDSKNQVDEKSLTEDAHFLDLIVKAKLYNADVTYRKKEYDALNSILAKPGKAKQIETFLAKAFLWHSRRKREYPTSPLATMLAKAQQKK